MGTVELPRITGTELETCILLRDAKFTHGHIDNETARRILDGGLPNYLGRAPLFSTTAIPPNGYFVTNGSRIYPDVGHIEYATPEDDSFWGTAANEIAQETVLCDTLDTYVRKSGTESYSYHKRVIDTRGTTWGYHENYFMPQADELPKEPQLGAVLAHLATRQVFTGTGYQKANGAFTLSQKLNVVSRNTAGGTIQIKPLICTRDESHTGHDQPGERLQVVCGDPNMSPWGTFMKLATTSLVLRLVEHGVGSLPYLGYDTDYAKMAVRFCGDISLRTITQTPNGTRVSAMNIQEMLLDRCQQLAERIQLPPEEEQALGMWEQVLADLQEDPHKARNRVEWVLKYEMLGRFAAKHALNERAPELQEFDLQWDAVSDNGTGIKLRKSAAAWKPWVNAALAKERVGAPPDTTRALPRSLFITMLPSKYSGSVNWNQLKYGDRPALQIANPFDSSIEGVARLFAA